jgi:murein DD-endopeptidase MepM/ murein hydrolase activator NlpD
MTTPTRHTVAPGETIYHLALEYGVTSEQLMAANDISDPRELRAGQTIVIPSARSSPAGDSADVAGDDSETTTAALNSADAWAAPVRAARQMAWPVTAGVLSSPFGMRNGTMHQGIDIAAPRGTPIKAADDGVVIFAGQLRGYGNVVILQHDGGYVTVYGHNERNLVSEGTRVERGQEIAEMGATGRARGSNLHFEVRRDNHPENPMAYLPAPVPQSGISFARAGASE